MRCVFLLTATLLSLPGVVLAAEIESIPVPPLRDDTSAVLSGPLSLSAALDRAAQLNPALQRARIAVRNFAGARQHASRAVPSNPQVSLQSYERETATGGGDLNIAITVSQELWIAGQGGMQKRAGDSRLRAAQQRLDFLESSVAARVRAAFLQTLVAREAVTSAQNIVNANRDLAEFSERRLRAGEANQLEANVSRIGLGRAESFLAQAENDYEQARLHLAELLWLDPQQVFDLSGEVDPGELNIPDVSELLRRAVTRRGDLAAASELVVAAREELKLAKRQLIPNLTVFAVNNSDTNIEREVLAGVSLELPILHRYGGEREQAAAQLDDALLERDSINLGIRSDILSALAAYRAARRSLTFMSDEVMQSASQNLELTRIAFEAGEVDATALSTAQNVLINTRSEYLEALSDLVQAGTDLERSTGGILVMSNGSASTN